MPGNQENRLTVWQPGHLGAILPVKAENLGPE